MEHPMAQDSPTILHGTDLVLARACQTYWDTISEVAHVLEDAGGLEPDDMLEPLHSRIVRSISLITATRAHSLAALHEKAAVILEQDAESRLAVSLARDVLAFAETRAVA
jgi:hypothetical protein